MLLSSVAVWVGTSIYPVIRFLTPKAEASDGDLESVKLENARDIPKNSSMIVPFGDEPVILIRDNRGKFHAHGATCTHLSCTVQYDAKTEQIVCPCHEGIFNLSGNVVSGPPKKPLRGFKVKINAKHIMTIWKKKG